MSVTDANVSQTGINPSIDGIGDFFGQLGSQIGSGLLQFGQGYINQEYMNAFPEQFPPQDNTGSTGSPQDTAVNEIDNGGNGESMSINKRYVAYGIAAVVALGAIVYIARS